MARFQQYHFPADHNPNYELAGTRTLYSIERRKFPTAQDTLLWVDGKGLEVPKGQQLTFLQPPELVDYRVLGAPRGTYAQVKVGHKLGHMPISHIEKPRGDTSRSDRGIQTQQAVAGDILARAGDMGLSISLDHMAHGSSQTPDLIFSGPSDFQVEVKGTVNLNAPTVLFDQSVRRGEPRPAIDQVADLMVDALDFSCATGTGSFERAIDYCAEHVNPLACMAEDDRGPKGGKIPALFISSDEKVTGPALTIMRSHFAGAGDNYFALHDRVRQKTHLWHTGHGCNILEAPALSSPKRFGLTPYGGSYKGATRVGVAAQFEIDS
jgi:hypothetical protein